MRGTDRWWRPFASLHVLEVRIALTFKHPHSKVGTELQIFRKLDGLAGEIEAKQPPVEHWRRFVYCTTLAGPVLGTVDHLQPQGMLHRPLLCLYLSSVFPSSPFPVSAHVTFFYFLRTWC